MDLLEVDRKCFVNFFCGRSGFCFLEYLTVASMCVTFSVLPSDNLTLSRYVLLCRECTHLTCLRLNVTLNNRFVAMVSSRVSALAGSLLYIFTLPFRLKYLLFSIMSFGCPGIRTPVLPVVFAFL